ncbi:ATP-binding protein [Nannocystis pusilla]|uniref:ATP-binding protein n=1 Tax=Nannocystis pusilla TaxID=889268 RepID=UPI003B79EF1F
MPTTFYGREAQIRQILGLLGQNAIARAPGGEIRIAVEPVPGDKSSHQLLFSVRDTGYPLTDTTASIDFDPLTSGARSQGGRLDLAICRLLVLSLGGRMSAGNTTGNTATVFFTVLGGVAPGSQQTTLVNQLGETQAVASMSGGGWKNSFEASARLARLAIPDADATTEPERRTGSVLVVDDSPTSRELLAHQCGKPATRSRSRAPPARRSTWCGSRSSTSSCSTSSCPTATASRCSRSCVRRARSSGSAS